MQFVLNGPDIPERLLQQHEEGRVVFFCGAGISYPAGLPGFKGLVEKLYLALGTLQDDLEAEAFKKEHYDATIDLLERRYPGQRIAVRRALVGILKPNTRLKGARDTHKALLDLGRARDGAVRIVTTNFDRIFEGLTKGGNRVPAHAAPSLPIPKNSRWHGVVYLHGLLPEKPDDSALNRLVVSSGDFGLAYLTERWAARFVTELFRNYVVCFVGYSINDPVLRYMMDALAADRMLGEVVPEAYAFADCESGDEPKKLVEWEAKGVTPILYQRPAGTHDHTHLHLSLKRWGEIYRDATQGKEALVAQYGLSLPLASTKQDDFVGRMLWALSDASGLPAKRFAELDPVPSLDWLEPLSEDRFRQPDLIRFGVPPKAQHDATLVFSLIRRPAPYTHAPRMMLFDADAGPHWDDVMFQISNWLIRHLGDPKSIWWLARHGYRLHPHFTHLVSARLDHLAALERADPNGELDEIRRKSPNAVPGKALTKLWKLFCLGRLKKAQATFDLYDWSQRLLSDGPTASLRIALREMLAPRITLTGLARPDAEGEKPDPGVLRTMITWELVLAADYVYSALPELREPKGWNKVLPVLLGEFQSLLEDALDLQRELGGADELHDGSYWTLSSISRHWQNRGFHEWGALIELVRDAWVATLEIDPARAAGVVAHWISRPYPTFKRLAFFAATHPGIVTGGEWVDWLVRNDAWWLWSVETQREVMRLLVLRGAALPKARLRRLLHAVLTGPPRRMFKVGVKRKRWRALVDHEVWLRLAKLELGGAVLTLRTRARLSALSAANPAWRLEANESDEFPHWMSGTGDPDYESRQVVVRAPSNRRELAQWLMQPPNVQWPFTEDDWADVCRHNARLAARALILLSRDRQFPIGRWQTALQIWSQDAFLAFSWRIMPRVLANMPDDVLKSLANGFSWFLEAQAKGFAGQEDHFLLLCRRCIQLDFDINVSKGETIPAYALNHPIGHATQALLHFWYRKPLADNQELSSDVEPLFAAMCDSSKLKYRPSRTLLCSNVIALFRVDPAWAKRFLLPLFEWPRSAEEAQNAWQGFLMTPRLHRPLLSAMKASFLETARHYESLGEYARGYAALLTYVALDPGDSAIVPELQAATLVLPAVGLQECMITLGNALESAGDQREAQWENRIKPYWRSIWPKSRELASAALSMQLARLAIAAGAAFGEAINLFMPWFQRLDNPHYVVHRLVTSSLSKSQPEPSLALLDAVVGDRGWPSPGLQTCLDDIRLAAANLGDDRRFVRLANLARKRG